VSIRAAKRRTEREQQQIDALQQRVHPDSERRTCWCCGIAAYVPIASRTVERRGLDGSPLVYGICAQCAALRREGTLDRVVLVERLGVDPIDPILGHVKVPAFADVVGHRPERPNTEPWSHLSDRELGQMIVDARREWAESTTAPCRYCGDIRRHPDGGLTDGGACQSCYWHKGESLDDEALRDHAAGWLAGVNTAVSAMQAGFGMTAGLRFFFELEPDQQRGALAPFAWHSDAELVRWREMIYPTPPPYVQPEPRMVTRPIGGGAPFLLDKRWTPPTPPDPKAVVAARRAKW
jgi:hypothetical protein